MKRKELCIRIQENVTDLDNYQTKVVSNKVCLPFI